MRRILIQSLAFAMSLSTSAFAGPLDVSAPASVQTLAALGPVVQKVYPPLPTLAMLPPADQEQRRAQERETQIREQQERGRAAGAGA